MAKGSSPAAEYRRRGIAEQQRQDHRGKTIKKAVTLCRQRDEAFESSLADLDVARGDRDHAAAADQKGFGAIGADRHPRRHRNAPRLRQRGKPLAGFGLKPRDIVREINGETIDTPEKLRQAAEQDARWWRFTIERDGQLLRQMLRY